MNFTRTLVESKIFSSRISRNEAHEIVYDDMPVITYEGKIDEERAQKIINKTYGKNPIVILDHIEEVKTKRKMSMDDFVNHSEIVK